LYITDAEAQFSHTVASVEFLARNGRVPDMIVVGIVNDQQRPRDLTPTRGSLIGAGGVAKFPTSGGAGTFLSFIDKELIPYIDTNYRTRPFRILAGHSFGALFALYAFATSPDLFNAYIAASPTLTWDGDFVERTVAVMFVDRKSISRDLFIAMANEEAPNVAAYYRLRALLTEKAPRHLAWETRLLEDEDHGSSVLTAYYYGLRYVFRDWRAPLDRLSDLAAVESHYAALSAKLGYEVRPPEQTLNSLGYRKMSSGDLGEAFLLLQRNVELYSASPNVYDSLGDVLERQGKLELARNAYAKALKLAVQKQDPGAEVFKSNLERVNALLRDRR
jgi:predicted alpha/beta superfamily hydrolase